MILQHVEAGNTKAGQKVKFLKGKSFYTVLPRTKKGWTKVKKGKRTIEMTNSTKLLQKPFANL